MGTLISTLSGWGRVTRVESACIRPETRADLVDSLTNQRGRTFVGRGLGKAYGDAALNSSGLTVMTDHLDRVLAFDQESGWLHCEGGVKIADIIRIFLPRGFFPPVVPGTQFVTVAGALASDIHGKNHHVAGSFSNHVRDVHLLTGTGEITIVDSNHHSELFRATTGGMGLTGIILSLSLRLIRVASSAINVETIRVSSLDEYLDLSKENASNQYTVGWIDTMKRGRSLGRGLLFRGDHAPAGVSYCQASVSRLPRRLFEAKLLRSDMLLNRVTLGLLNSVYYRRVLRRRQHKSIGFEPYFFQLDGLTNWNQLYGNRGFYQYQFVIPHDPDLRAVRAALTEIAHSDIPSFLGVIKEMGDTSNGLLSFPISGTTIAVDFPNVGDRLHNLLERLDDLVIEAGGRVYLAKDARLNLESFRRMYPEWESWREIRDSSDPNGMFASDLGRRLGLVKE